MVLALYGFYGDGTCGVFELPYPQNGVTLTCVASSSEGWDHVSVSLKHRTPNWYEMQHAHRTFFRDDETAWQYQVAKKDHVNVMPNCLHLWRKHGFDMPLPPTELV